MQELKDLIAQSEQQLKLDILILKAQIQNMEPEKLDLLRKDLKARNNFLSEFSVNNVSSGIERAESLREEVPMKLGGLFSSRTLTINPKQIKVTKLGASPEHKDSDSEK